MAGFQLVMRSSPNTGKVFPLTGKEIMIGRDTTNNIVIKDAEMSRKHARLTLQGGGYVIEDLGSTNGTFVDGQRLSQPRPLRAGEVISFGENIMLAYEAMVDVNATMVSAAKRTAAKAQPVSAPPPAPAYAGQVPSGPAVPARKPLRPIVIIGIVVALVVFGCILFFVILDQLNLWCPFLRMVGINWQYCP